MAIQKDREIVRQHIRDTGAEVVIFDPFYLSALGGAKNVEASNVMQMGPLIREMEDAVKQENATPVFVHHFNREVKVGAKPELKDMTYAGAGETAAQWLLLNHRVPFDAETGECKIWMLWGGRAGQHGLAPLTSAKAISAKISRGGPGTSPSSAPRRSVSRPAADHRRVYGPNKSGTGNGPSSPISQPSPRGKGRRSVRIHEAVHTGPNPCQRALRELEVLRLVTPVQVTRRGREWDGWAATDAGRKRARQMRSTSEA